MNKNKIKAICGILVYMVAFIILVGRVELWDAVLILVACLGASYFTSSFIFYKREMG